MSGDGSFRYLIKHAEKWDSGPQRIALPCDSFVGYIHSESRSDRSDHRGVKSQMDSTTSWTPGPIWTVRTLSRLDSSVQSRQGANRDRSRIMPMSKTYFLPFRLAPLVFADAKTDSSIFMWEIPCLFCLLASKTNSPTLFNHMTLPSYMTKH